MYVCGRRRIIKMFVLALALQLIWLAKRHDDLSSWWADTDERIIGDVSGTGGLQLEPLHILLPACGRPSGVQALQVMESIALHAHKGRRIDFFAVVDEDAQDIIQNNFTLIRQWALTNLQVHVSCNFLPNQWLEHMQDSAAHRFKCCGTKIHPTTLEEVQKVVEENVGAELRRCILVLDVDILVFDDLGELISWCSSSHPVQWAGEDNEGVMMAMLPLQQKLGSGVISSGVQGKARSPEGLGYDAQESEYFWLWNAGVLLIDLDEFLASSLPNFLANETHNWTMPEQMPLNKYFSTHGLGRLAHLPTWYNYAGNSLCKIRYGYILAGCDHPFVRFGERIAVVHGTRDSFYMHEKWNNNKRRWYFRAAMDYHMAYRDAQIERYSHSRALHEDYSINTISDHRQHITKKMFIGINLCRTSSQHSPPNLERVIKSCLLWTRRNVHIHFELVGHKRCWPLTVWNHLLSLQEHSKTPSFTYRLSSTIAEAARKAEQEGSMCVIWIRFDMVFLSDPVNMFVCDACADHVKQADGSRLSYYYHDYYYNALEDKEKMDLHLEELDKYPFVLMNSNLCCRSAIGSWVQPDIHFAWRSSPVYTALDRYMFWALCWPTCESEEPLRWGKARAHTVIKTSRLADDTCTCAAVFCEYVEVEFAKKAINPSGVYADNPFYLYQFKNRQNEDEEERSNEERKRYIEAQQLAAIERAKLLGGTRKTTKIVTNKLVADFSDRRRTTERPGLERRRRTRGRQARKEEKNKKNKKERGEELWLAMVRIQKTASTYLGSTVRPKGFGGECGYRDCRCHTRTRDALAQAPHGLFGKFPCAEMDCVEKCRSEGKRSFWTDPPHADWADLESGFVRAGVDLSKIRWVTALRDPVQRVVSEYLHVRHRLDNPQCKKNIHKERYAWDYAAPCEMTLYDFATCSTCDPGVHNRQTRMLAGAGLSGWKHYYEGNATRMLETAKLHLRNMHWFAVKERWDDSIAYLHCAFRDVRTLASASDSSENPFRKSRPEEYKSLADQPRYAEALELLKTQNTLDFSLYNYALELLKTRIHACDQRNAAQDLIQQADQSLDTDLDTNGDLAVCEEDPTKDTSVIVGYGLTLHESFLDNHPSCRPLEVGKLGKFDDVHIGSMNWYASQHACAYNWELYKTVVYRHTSGARFEVRTFAPRPMRTLPSGQYIVAFGAAQVLGTQTLYPFGSYLEAALGWPFIPIAWGGAGPDFFTKVLDDTGAYGRLTRSLVKNAGLIIVASMSGRSVAIPGCSLLCGNMYCDDGMLVETRLRALLKKSNKGLHFQMLRKEWINAHLRLVHQLQKLARPKGTRVLFLYLSEYTFPKKQREFPQYVEEDWLDTMKAELQDDYVEVIGRTGSSKLIPLTGTPCGRCMSRGSDVCAQGQLSACGCGYLNKTYSGYFSDDYHKVVAKELVARIKKPGDFKTGHGERAVDCLTRQIQK